MADQSLHSPTNPHFFQPLLPGFHTHLNIPIAFFSRHVQGRNDHIKIAKLRSDASDQTWIVKVDGLKLTNGWEDFVVAHDLRVGDIIIFRHEGEMVFHVTALGRSFCVIQYTSSPSHNINDDSHGPTNNIVTGNGSREKRKRVKKEPRKKVESSSDHSRFVANVTAWSLRVDRLYLPRSFASSNGLDKMSGEKIVLRNEEGRSWSLKLKYHKSGMQTLVRPGWTRFCNENGMSHGLYTFKLVQKSGPPVIRLCRAEHRPKSEPEFSLNRSCYVGSVSPSSLISDRLYLRRDFVSANGLDQGYSEIVLKNQWGRRWTLALNHYRSLNYTTIGPGWKSFRQANGIKARDSFKFKLVKTGEKPVLSLCPADSNRDKMPLEFFEDIDDDVNSISSNDSSKSQESEKERLGDKSISQECLEMEKKKYSSRCSASSSYSQDRFVTITLTPYAVRKYKLFLPLSFTRVNGINKPVTIILLGQDGAKWVVDLLEHKKKWNNATRKWRDLCGAQGVKLGDSFVLELFWEDEASPVLKFCAKLNTV